MVFQSTYIGSLRDMKRKRCYRSSGFTLIEIMISLALGLLLAAGIISLFVGSKRNYNDNERSARLQENGRAALYHLANDLRHANFWGPVLDVTTIDTSGIDPDGIPNSGDEHIQGTCNSWASTRTDNFVGAVSTSSNPPIGSAPLSCLPASLDIKPNTSVVGIKHVSQGAVAFADFNANDVFLRGNSVGGRLLVKGAAGVGAPAADETDWEYQPRIYFIRTFSTAGDGIPTLCVIRGIPTLSTNCLVEGIEDLQLEYGLDLAPAGDRDGIPETYEAPPPLADMNNVAAVKIYLLVRDVELDPLYTNGNTYPLGNRTVGPFNDNFHRAVFSTTVIPHNQRNLPLR